MSFCFFLLSQGSTSHLHTVHNSIIHSSRQITVEVDFPCLCSHTYIHTLCTRQKIVSISQIKIGSMSTFRRQPQVSRHHQRGGGGGGGGGGSSGFVFYVLLCCCLWIQGGLLLPTLEAFSVVNMQGSRRLQHYTGAAYQSRRVVRVAMSLSSSSSNKNVEENIPLLPEERQRSVGRVLTLVEKTTGEILAQGYELNPFPEERDKPDEDELEFLYPTQRQFFQFGGRPQSEDGDNDSSPTQVPALPPVQKVRTTSFGCSKHGHQVWPSSMALCLSLIHDYYGNKDAENESMVRPRSVLELGAGMGLPSIVCRDVLQIPSVIATDFWYLAVDDGSEEREPERLIPEVWHGINLAYNVERKQEGAIVQRLDWHDLETVRQAGPNIDLVIGSDLVYYFMDIDPLWNTLETLIRDCGASKVVLISPIKPDTRESLPAFLEVLASKSADVGYLLQREELILYKSQEELDAREGGDRLVRVTLSAPQQH